MKKVWIGKDNREEVGAICLMGSYGINPVTLEKLEKARKQAPEAHGIN